MFGQLVRAKKPGSVHPGVLDEILHDEDAVWPATHPVKVTITWQACTCR